MALQSNGTLHGWGLEARGEISFGAAPSNLVSVAAANGLTIGLTSEGKVLTWGMPVLPGLSNIVAIDSGPFGYAALDASGKVSVWNNPYSDSLRRPPESLTNAIAIAVGRDHALALLPDGSVIGWTSGSAQLLPPTNLSNIVAIAAGSRHSLALREDGMVFCWGVSGYPEVAPVPKGLTHVTSITAGSHHSLAVRGTGKPVITISPFSQTISAGAPATLYAKAVGVQPLRFQWQLNGMNIVGETNVHRDATDTEACRKLSGGCE